MEITNQNIRIEPRTAYATEVKKGARIKITQSEGPQLTVLVAFNARDLSEYFSRDNTRISLAMGPFKRPYSTVLMPYCVTTGDILVSNRWNKMLSLLEDTFGKHDIVFGPCDSFLNVIILGQPEGYPCCRELHADALKKWGVSYDTVPSGVNLFQNTSYSETGMVTFPTKSETDDMVLLEPHDDLVVSVTACPCPLGENRPIMMELLPPQ